MGFAQLRLRSGENMLGFAQILWVLLIFVLDFLLRSREFGSNLTTIWFFFSLDLVSLAQIRRQFDFFCSNLVSFVQIWQRSDKKYRSPPKSNLWQHFVGFNRPAHRYFQSNPTWPVGFCGRLQVVSPGTRCHRVGYGLGTDPTWTDLWTPLDMTRLARLINRSS